MPNFGKKSLERLETCDVKIQQVMHEAIKQYDFSVLEGHRVKDKQEEYFKSGASKVKFPNSKHNKYPSLAVDIIPYPVDWENLQRFQELALVIKEACKTVGVSNLHWGYDMWKWDLPHWELSK